MSVSLSTVAFSFAMAESITLKLLAVFVASGGSGCFDIMGFTGPILASRRLISACRAEPEEGR